MAGRLWTPEAEETLIELWQESACLYDISSADYHNREEKDKRWKEVADALQMPAEAVATRVASLRTQYARLRKPKPKGSDNKPLTMRQRWLLRALDFLKPHIVHRRSENTLGLPSSDKVEDDDSDELMQETDKEVDSFDSISVCLSPMPGTPDTGIPEETASYSLSPRSTSGKRSRTSESDIELQKLEVLKQMSAKVLENPTPDAAAVFASQVAMEYRLLSDPTVQMRVRRQIMALLYEAQDSERRSRQTKKHEQRELKTEEDVTWINTNI
ncbi:hypothetical protein ROHU_014990 [Labeo rohita]|uniref:tRNA-2-methylthio-N(6)-dimethylallyladenosine synthase n=2 Tax=Labeo rohita TaxID=84645 RepID=A0ABQ8LIB5_LABRO|nr:uncharacterized protein wu:fb74b10 isoform X1 [Labeo rohita]KAI2649408.1 tRNA-2-methylthio-N(6)-dimethylallyladenosine synthase [Labeo rohita]RXN34267.1 hypothetical protein ROHU_014990 [Labeo rohita]